jgi:hypothetical protein
MLFAESKPIRHAGIWTVTSGVEHIVPAILIIAKFKEGERQWHFNYDG